MLRRLAGPFLLVLPALFPQSSASAEPLFEYGFETPCDPLDADDDRLSGCQEMLLKTDPDNPDTDDDGLSDGDEVLGTLGGLDLPGMGVNPRRKDILIEHDWTDDATGCVQHSHKPQASILSEIRQLFSSAPVLNPDGSFGINLIHDFGQGGFFTGGNFIAIPEGTLEALQDDNYMIFKPANFDANRIGYFHYMLHAHAYTHAIGSLGAAEVWGDESLITMGCFHNDAPLVRNIITHEFGHNLGLLHGGNSNCNWKPNYNSVMNYRFTRYGVDVDCDSGPDGVTDFSSGTNVAIDENDIDEGAGVCGDSPINWNFTPPDNETGLVMDINITGNGGNTHGYVVPEQELAECGGFLTVLTDYDDWGNLDLSVLPTLPEDGNGVVLTQVINCQSFPTN